jgi:hypothetical protein
MSCGTRAQTSTRAILMAPVSLRSFPLNELLSTELPGARARSRRLHRGTAHLPSLLGTATAELRYCSRRPLITAGHPVRSSVPSPSCNRSGFETPPPHRSAYCDYMYCCPPVRLCRALLISATRETITTPEPNVYSGRHRFPCARRRANRPRTEWSQPVAATWPVGEGAVVRSSRARRRRRSHGPHG